MALDRDRFRRGGDETEKPEQKKVILTPDNKIPGAILPTSEKKEEIPPAVKAVDQPEQAPSVVQPVEPAPVEVQEIPAVAEKLPATKERKPIHAARKKLLALRVPLFALRPRKGKWVRLAGVAFISLVFLFAVGELVILVTHKNPPVKPKTIVDTKYVYTEVEAGNVEVPFRPAVPNDEPQLAQLAATNYSAIAKSYTFSDLYLGVPLEVSEQEMPKTFPTPSQTLAAVSKSLPANTSFTGQYGTIYMNNSTSPTKQTLAFSRFGLLIFIQTNYDINNAGWISYIDNLEQAD